MTQTVRLHRQSAKKHFMWREMLENGKTLTKSLLKGRQRVWLRPQRIAYRSAMRSGVPLSPEVKQLQALQ